MNEVSSFLCSYLPGASGLHIHYVVPVEIEVNRTQRKEYFEYEVEICLELCIFADRISNPTREDWLYIRYKL